MRILHLQFCILNGIFNYGAAQKPLSLYGSTVLLVLVSTSQGNSSRFAPCLQCHPAEIWNFPAPNPNCRKRNNLTLCANTRNQTARLEVFHILQPSLPRTAPAHLLFCCRGRSFRFPSRREAFRSSARFRPTMQLELSATGTFRLCTKETGRPGPVIFLCVPQCAEKTDESKLPRHLNSGIRR